MIKQFLWMFFCSVVIVPNSNAMYGIFRVSFSPAAAKCAQMSCVTSGNKKNKKKRISRCFPRLEEQKMKIEKQKMKSFKEQKVKSKEQVKKWIEQDIKESE
ncbi:MAG: hypothetical protein WD055_00140 [Candidatus Dependentiae bacterium]